MKQKSAIQKGKNLENYIADQIKAKGLDDKAKRSIGSGSGTREKADIDTSLQILGRNIGIEAKHHNQISYMAWWKQTRELEKVGREPVLAIKQTNEDYGHTKVVIYLDTFLDMCKRCQEPTTVDTDSYEMKWVLKNIITNCKKLLKLLEN